MPAAILPLDFMIESISHASKSKKKKFRSETELKKYDINYGQNLPYIIVTAMKINK